MSKIRSLFANLFRSLSSKGRGLAVCDCELHPIWDSSKPLYNTDDVVIHEENVYIAASTEGCEPDDIPGQSVHWIHVCNCPPDITPTPTPTPEPVLPTPTPTPTIDDCPTPTPTLDDVCRCSDYVTWEMKQYASFEIVSWKGSLWEAFEWEGTDANDEPGKSIHWRHICDCVTTPTPTEIICCGNDSTEYDVGPDSDTQVLVDVGVTINKFVYTGTLCIPASTLDYCSNLITPVTVISPENKNIGTIIFYGGVNNDSIIYLSIEDSSFAEQNEYATYNNVCLYGKIIDGTCTLTEIE